MELIRSNLKEDQKKVEVKSVDGYQGREKEVVLLSLVRSNSNREVGFLSERRRLNVAVTRAKRQVIVICDSETVGSDQFLSEFLHYLSVNGAVESAEMYIDDLPEIIRPPDISMVKSMEKPKEEAKKVKKSKKPSKQDKLVIYAHDQKLGMRSLFITCFLIQTVIENLNKPV